MKKAWIGALCLAIPLVAGCTEKRVDTSSDETMKHSVAQVRESLPLIQREDFDAALKTLIASHLDMKQMFTNAMAGDTTLQGTTANLADKLKGEISGKTGPQIIAYAGDIRRERDARAKAQAFEEIKELKAKKVMSDKAKEELANFVVLRSRFYKQAQRYGNDKPIIELSVKNNTARPISRAYFEGTIASPNRAVPWLRETFNYKISGGLEPGEEAEWTLAPNQFSDWGKVEAPADAILTVTVTGLDGADEKTLFSSNDFSKRDAERLALLLKQYGQRPETIVTPTNAQ